jgi:hypothetical protein
MPILFALTLLIAAVLIVLLIFLRKSVLKKNWGWKMAQRPDMDRLVSIEDTVGGFDGMIAFTYNRSHTFGEKCCAL